MFPHLMAHLHVARPGPGRPRTRPERVRADKAYSSRAVAQRRRARVLHPSNSGADWPPATTNSP
jgi:hypothetical protein